MARIQLVGGLFQDASGLPLSNGYLTMELSHDEQETVDPGQVVAGIKLRIQLDENGNIVGGTQVWPNDQLTPAGSYYIVNAFKFNGERVWKSAQFWTLTGAGPITPPPPNNPPASGGTTSTTNTFAVVSALVGKPVASQIVCIYTAFSVENFPNNFASPQSYGSVGTNPTSTATYTITKNGSQVGSAAIAANGAFTFSTVGGTGFTMNPGDRMTIVAPSSPDATLSDVGITLVGMR